MKRWDEISAPKNAYASIIQGDRPVLYWPADGECPVKAGDEIVIYDKKLWLEIDRVSQAKKGEAYLASYTVQDRRGRYLARHNGYTSSPKLSIDREASVVEPAIVNNWAKEARERNAARQTAKRKADPARYQRAVIDRLRATVGRLDNKAAIAVLEEVDKLLQSGPTKASNPDT